MNGNNTKIKAIGAALFLALALLPLRPVSVPAQGTVDALAVQEALERTDEIILRAGQLIDESRSEKARVALRFATELQARAWNDYRGASYHVALRLTLQARKEAWHAMSLARSDLRSEESLQRVAEEARERLITVRDEMIEGGVRDEHALKLVDEGNGLLDKSRMNAQQNRYQLAFRLATNARQVAITAEDHVRNTRRLKESVERRVMLMERLVERSRQRVNESGDEKIRAELRVAERKLAQAQELLAAGRYDEARQACETCEQMLRGIVRSVPPAAAGNPSARLEEGYRLLDRSRQMAAAEGETPDPLMAETMERVGEMLDRAGESIGAGRGDEGIALIDRAMETLRKTVREEHGALTRERIMTRIADAEALRGQTQNLVDTCPAPGARELAARADAHLARAREHAGAARFESAAAEIAIARNMYQRIGDLCAR